MTIGDRVKQLRKDKNMTLEAFGKQVGVGKTSISKLEHNTCALTDQMAISICREFGVNKDWLESGIGEMYVKSDVFDLGEYAKQHGITDLELEIIKTYLKIPVAKREAVERDFEELWNARNGAAPDLQSRFPATPEELEKMYPPVNPDQSDVG